MPMPSLHAETILPDGKWKGARACDTRPRQRRTVWFGLFAGRRPSSPKGRRLRSLTRCRRPSSAGGRSATSFASVGHETTDVAKWHATSTSPRRHWLLPSPPSRTVFREDGSFVRSSAGRSSSNDVGVSSAGKRTRLPAAL